MHRNHSFGRRRKRAVSQRTAMIRNQFRPSFEALEPRTMLSASDLLIGQYDTGGVLRYDEATQAPAAGAVTAGDNGLDSVSGLAVAPDGTFYVSEPDAREVFHYSNSGVFLGYLGENDGTKLQLEKPGTLAFGPNGNLYVADLGASSVYQFNVNSATQQYQVDDTTVLTQAYDGEFAVPGGIAFAANGDLIVGDLSSGSVADYHDGVFESYFIDPFTSVGANDTGDGNVNFLEPASILAENNGDLLIADVDYDYTNFHHQVVLYNAATQSTSMFINLTTPLGTNPGFVGDNAQPVSLLMDQDGNLLVGVSADGAPDGAVQEYNINTGCYMTTVASGIDTPAGLAYVPSEQSDLLVGDYDDGDVLRYNDSTDAQVPGGVAAGVPNPNPQNVPALGSTESVAVAPNGTYYVSSYGVNEVYHYSSAGVYLGYLGENDIDPVELQQPGVLAFGPDGNLYVADMGAAAVYQFNVNSPTQQYQSSGTTVLTQAYEGEFAVPGGIAFTASGDLIVGDLGSGSVADYHDGAFASYFINPFTSVGANDSGDGDLYFLEPASILAESNGNLLIADFDYDYTNFHHQVVLYNAATQATSMFIDLDKMPLGTDPGFVGNYPQPVSLLTDQDGNLLVGVSPDGPPDGAVLEYNINTGCYISTVVSGIGTPAGLAMIPVAPILTTSGGAAAYTAGGSGVTVDAALTLSDVNTLPTLSATVTISAGTLQSGDTLNFVNQNGISGNYSAGTLNLTGSATVAQYQAALQSITFSSTSTSTAQRTISFTATDGTQSSVTETDEINVSAPVTVTGVYVKGSNWTSPYLTYLAAHAPGGSATLGYELQTGSAQLTTLPWANINTIEVQFSGPVSGVATGSLELVGGTGVGAVAAPTVTGESYLGNNTYAWTLSGPLDNNKYVIAVASTNSSFGPAVVDANAAGISGEFATGSSTFANDGNGLAGGTFDFSFNVLPGDANQNGTDNSSDSAFVKGELNDRTTTAGYNYLADYNGTGTINSADTAVDDARLNVRNSTLTAPSAPSAGSVGVVSLGTDLALGVIETGNPTTTTTITPLANVVSTPSPTPSTSSSTTTSTSGSGSAGAVSGSTVSGSTVSGSIVASSASQTTQNQATDQAVSDFELVDLYV